MKHLLLGVALLASDVPAPIQWDIPSTNKFIETQLQASSCEILNEEIAIIDERNLVYKDFRICDRLNKRKPQLKYMAHISMGYVKPSRSKRYDEYNSFRNGICLGYTDGKLRMITITFPRRDTTARGISVGATREEVERKYGKPRNDLTHMIKYTNIGFDLHDGLVYGIFIYDENNCEPDEDE